MSTSQAAFQSNLTGFVIHCLFYIVSFLISSLYGTLSKIHNSYFHRIMEPRIIHMVISPPDLIGDLLRARQHQLGTLYPEFKE